jgi:hypothetical protein
MKVAHLYTGQDGRSHFADLDIPLTPVSLGEQWSPGSSEVIFRQTQVGSEQDYHPAPRRQFVITLSGKAEIECGDGTKRTFGAGDIMLADDTTGQGHITRVTEGPRRFLFVPLSDSVDVNQWRV